MNIFSRIIRDIREAKEGRIVRVPAYWKLAPGETREDGSYPTSREGDETALFIDRYVRVSTDKQGRKMHLVRRKAVHCPNPEYADKFASLNEQSVCLSVPESFCRKCPLYQTARKTRSKYATCAYKRSENSASDTIKEFGT